MGNRTSAVLQSVKRRKRGVANVVSVGAIGALALGTLGTGVATAQNMVGSGDIENQSIRSWDIHRDAVGQSELRGAHDDRGPAVKSHQVANESLLHWDIANGTLQPQDFSQKAKDALEGEQGEQGPPGVTNYEVDGFYKEVTPDGSTQTVTVTCAEDKNALGGGFSVEHPDQNLQHIDDVVASRFTGLNPIEGDPEHSTRATGWQVTVETKDADAEPFNVRPWVSCANVN